MLSSLPVVKASPDHLRQMMALFDKCRQDMRLRGIQQWPDDYPHAQQVNADIAAGEVFMISADAGITGTITLNSQQDEQYAGIDWQWQSEKILVIHRLAVLPEAQGQGLGRLLCEFAESYARNNGFDGIRLDAYQGNQASAKLYRRLGYQLAAGVCWFHGNDLPFLCWEKRVLKKGQEKG